MQHAPIAPMETQTDFLVFNEIAIINQLAQGRLEKHLPRGMSTAQFSVLNHFARRGGRESPAQLAFAFQTSKGAMTNTLQRLEAAGLIAVEPHGEDGRRKLVSITPAGLVAHDTAARALQPDLDAMREAFTDGEFRAALPFLQALRGWLDEHRNPA